ncbi:MAG: proline dehydrogenase family protein [Candidatus Acidiferrales bacterium]
MGLARNALIAASQSRWLREHAMRWRFVRHASRRFLPGERYEDALAAARELAAIGVSSMLSRLGENVTEASEAEAVAEHYFTVLAGMRAAGLPPSLSVKPTQLGLDLDAALCERNLERILNAGERAQQAAPLRPQNDLRGIIWIDMEQSAYVDRTLELYRHARSRHASVGICLQTYLRRTPADLDSLLPLGPVIRLVKGAYHEPASIAYPAKRDVDEAFFALVQKLLSAEAAAAGARAGIGTHDPKLIERIVQLATSESAKGQGPDAIRSRIEFQMLYGIRRDLQRKLASEGWPVSVLISYGTHWFPWYMRRLAERPANVWFVLKNLFG